MSLPAVLFYTLAALTGVSALAVVLTQNIVRAAVWLLFTLAGVSGIFFLLGANFLGAAQLLVYVGGTLVLVVFGVMLTAQGPSVNLRIGAAEWAISVAAGLMLFGVLAACLRDFKAPSAPLDIDADRATMEDERTLAPSKYVGAALLGDTKVTPQGFLTGTLANRPRERTKISYLLPFEIVSVHLLVVLIGAAYLARAKRRRGAA
jgi:NADH-quinone oxidoreductase subunit J